MAVAMDLAMATAMDIAMAMDMVTMFNSLHRSSFLLMRFFSASFQF